MKVSRIASLDLEPNAIRYRAFVFFPIQIPFTLPVAKTHAGFDDRLTAGLCNFA